MTHSDVELLKDRLFHELDRYMKQYLPQDEHYNSHVTKCVEAALEIYVQSENYREAFQKGLDLANYYIETHNSKRDIIERHQLFIITQEVDELFKEKYEYRSERSAKRALTQVLELAEEMYKNGKTLKEILEESEKNIEDRNPEHLPAEPVQKRSEMNILNDQMHAHWKRIESVEKDQLKQKHKEAAEAFEKKKQSRWTKTHRLSHRLLCELAPNIETCKKSIKKYPDKWSAYAGHNTVARMNYLYPSQTAGTR